VESVLRYGLPPDFVSAIIQVVSSLDTLTKVHRKQGKALRKTLDKSYSYLGGHTFFTKDSGVSADEMAALQSVGAGDDYTPYVVFSMEWR
jgi:hypothetical protein